MNAIHEGTHGIQALDLLGRKVVMQKGAAFELLAASVRDTIEKSKAAFESAPELGAQKLATQLETRWARLDELTRVLHASGDSNRTLANATVYLEAFGHIVIAWMWLEQALAAVRNMQGRIANDSDDDFYRGKLAACRYFFAYELPKVGPMLDLLASLDDTTLTMQDAWF